MSALCLIPVQRFDFTNLTPTSKQVFKAAASDGRILVVRTYPDDLLSREEWNVGFLEAIEKLQASVQENSSLLTGRSGDGSLPLGFFHSNGNNNNVQYFLL